MFATWRRHGVAALALACASAPGLLLTVNLGTGPRRCRCWRWCGGLEAASGRPVRYQIAPRRAGDVAACWADPSLAEQLLGWRAQRDGAVLPGRLALAGRRGASGAGAGGQLAAVGRVSALVAPA